MENIKYTLFKHQEECIEYSKKKNKFILADQMGLGKTFESICVAITKKREVKHCLIVCCVNGMQYSWKSEILGATYEGVKVLGDRLGKRTKKWSIKGNKEKLEDLNNLRDDQYFIITNIEVFRNQPIVDKIKDLCRKGQIGMCIIDEPHLGCLSGDTLIDTTEGKLPIRDIVNSSKDFYVYAIDSSGDIVPRRVTERQVSQQPTNLIELGVEENGKIYTIKCTPNHPIRTRNRGYIPAECIDENDDIVVEDIVKGGIKYMGRLIRKCTIETSEYVYDIGVAYSSNYFANGVNVHNCKNSQSTQGKNIHKIVCKYKMLLTGTPLMNSPVDLYNLLKWINVEKHTKYQFEEYYCRKGGFGGYQIIGYKHLDELQETLDSCMLRRMKDDVLDLPPKIYKYEYVDLYPEQKKLYNEVKVGLVEKMEEIIALNPNPLAMLTGLRQVTECPQLVNETVDKCAKLDRMVELVDEIVGNGEKVLVFSNWSKVVNEAIRRVDKSYNPQLITGDVKVEDRQRIMKDFQITDNCKVIFGTIGAMGTGLTLTAATNVIFLSEPWTHASKVQAEDRVYRIGTKTSVNIITLITNDTIDEGIHETIMLKKYMSDALVDKTVEGMDLKKLFRNLLK